MNSLLKVCLVLVVAFALVSLFEIRDVESQTRPTATKTRTRTATASVTSTQTSTVTPSATVTPSPTITSSPTITLTPSPTPVQKTELKVFDNVTISPGGRIVSGIIDVSQFNEVTTFLYTKSGYYHKSTCYFFPIGGAETDRYNGTMLVNAVNGLVSDSLAVNASQSVFMGRIIGPRMICDVKSTAPSSTVIDFYLYLIP